MFYNPFETEVCSYISSGDIFQLLAVASCGSKTLIAFPQLRKQSEPPSLAHVAYNLVCLYSDEINNHYVAIALKDESLEEAFSIFSSKTLADING